MTISCMTLASYQNDFFGFVTRQFAIGDIKDVDFLQFPGGTMVLAGETSKINILNPGIRGSADHFAVADSLSQITIDGTITVSDNLHFGVAFLSSLNGSAVNVSSPRIDGGAAVTGASYQCNSSIINKSVALPGNDMPYTGNSHCTGSGVQNSADWQPAIDAVSAELAGEGRRLSAVQDELSSVRNELAADRAAAQAREAERSGDKRKQRRANRIHDWGLGLLTIAVVGGGGFAAYARLRRIRRGLRTQPPASR
jgi:hypothetical protein